MNDIDLRAFAGRRVAVGLSGGVDSSTVAALLAEAGAVVLGLTMSIWREGAAGGPAEQRGNADPDVASQSDACYGPGEKEDIEASAALCERLGAPFHAIDLSAEYEERILGYFRREYRAGRTPNPCVRCNAEMKFGFLLEKARAQGLDFDCFATGHYARIGLRGGRPILRRAVEEAKDQSYFIHRLAPELLAGLAFPLGDYSKAAVRNEARRLGLAVAEKPESQDFVSGGYASLFGDEESGDIVDEGGRVIGRHRGIVHYTIGQRRGLGVSTGPEPLYVSAIDAARNRVVVSSNASLFCSAIQGVDALLHDPSLEGGPFAAFVRIRQNHRPARARVRVQGEAARIDFDEPQRAAAPGQSAVFYDDEGFVLGGCVIAAAERPESA